MSTMPWRRGASDAWLNVSAWATILWVSYWLGFGLCHTLLAIFRAVRWVIGA